MKKVLFICYYFPPMGMGGTQRSAKFVKYLPQHGWTPIVLTVKNVSYYALDETLNSDVECRQIIRTESLDPLRVFARIRKNKHQSVSTSLDSNSHSRFSSILNRIISGWLLIPDSKILWLPFAVAAAIRLIRKNKIKLIFSTSPPHSAHIGALVLKLLTGVCWVADFRDDWTGGESQPCPTKFHFWSNRLLEKIVLKYSDAVIAMCDGLRQSLQQKQGYTADQSKFVVITNGYDADDFAGLTTISPNSKFTITHCGSVSRVSDPEPFLRAVSNLFQEQPDCITDTDIRFFGTDLFSRLNFLAVELGLEWLIRPTRYLPHRQSVEQLMRSHLLLLTILKTSDEEVITSKVFEYLASGRPILLISNGGEIARMIRSLNRGAVCRPDDIEGIKRTVFRYYQLYQTGQISFAEPLTITQYDRKTLTKQMSIIFDQILQRRLE